MTGHLLPALTGNPLLSNHRLFGAEPVPGVSDRDTLIRRYGFAVPTEEALQSIGDASPGGVVEVGAGTGYWARLLYERGVDVVAYDLFPPPSPDSHWFSGVRPWYPVARGGSEVVDRHADRTLLLVWPTLNEEWATRAAASYHSAGGTSLVYVGEGPGGRTGDEQFHALLSHYDQCVACAYDVANIACICGVERRWQLRSTVALPHWEGFHDDLHIYRRGTRAAAIAPPRSETGRRNRGRRWPRRRTSRPAAVPGRGDVESRS